MISQEKNGTKGRILIVEDDAHLAESLARYLGIEGYETVVAESAIKCYVSLDADPFDLVVLDLSLPDQDGLVLARYIRSNTNAAIIMLSARTAIDDRRMGYDAGAHLFLAKPIDFAEFTRSIEGTLHSRANEPQAVRTSAYEAIQESWVMLRGDWALMAPSGERAHLTSKEWDLLEVLSEESNEVVSREAILKTLGYPNNESGHHSLESTLYRLRKKTAEMGSQPIKTFHGNGYGFMAPLRVL